VAKKSKANAGGDTSQVGKEKEEKLPPGKKKVSPIRMVMYVPN